MTPTSPTVPVAPTPFAPTPAAPAPVAPAPVAEPSGPTHPCARCGAPVGPGVGLCDECNPLGLRDVASSQAHGTIFLGIAIAVVGLAVLARLAVAGIGPFSVAVAALEPAGDALSVTLMVTNEGSATGQTTCRLIDPAARGAGDDAHVLSPRIAPGETVTFTTEVTAFGSTARPLDVVCRAP